MNRYANIPGSSKIKDTYPLITEGFDGVQEDMDAKPDASIAQVNTITFGADDVLTIEAGTGITVVNVPGEKKIRIVATGTATPGPHGPEHDFDGSDPIPGLVDIKDSADAALPKAGGTMTGPITYGQGGIMDGNNGTNTKAMFYTGTDQAFLCSNAYFDKSVSQWNRYDTARKSALIIPNSDVSGVIEVRFAEPGANPITWSIYRAWHTNQLRWNAGNLEYNDGGTWKPVSKVTKTTVGTFTVPTAATWYTVLNISGGPGTFDGLLFTIPINPTTVDLKITIDGAEIYNKSNSLTAASYLNLLKSYHNAAQGSLPPSNMFLDFNFKSSLKIEVKYSYVSTATVTYQYSI